ncbi:type II toxin-antitoxin system PemK/MazF family toxin [Aeromicrobium sp. UC242_57]|uniref:type II toxin-antitoxin system PemK/MazF family toxin n=1 Tax=Aeromicrobium sp. UC242_57 TaxID=3374624 RepID=UPI003798D9F8
MDIEYDPHPDGEPDPGEVVWAWVPYEDDPSQGKDRPVLLIGREGTELVGLMLTSKDHDRDVEQEARAGRFWFDLGPGPWDSQGRPSEVRLNRLIAVDVADVRREGSVLDEQRFAAVVAALQPYLPRQQASS